MTRGQPAHLQAPLSVGRSRRGTCQGGPIPRAARKRFGGFANTQRLARARARALSFSSSLLIRSRFCSGSSGSGCERRPPFLWPIRLPARQPAPPSRSSGKQPFLTLSLPACAAPCLRAGRTVGSSAALWPCIRLAGCWPGMAEGLANGGLKGS